MNGKMINIKLKGGTVVVLLTVVAVPSISFPSIAQAGFFDFLFGPPPQTQPVGPCEASPGRPYEAYPGHFRRRADPSFHQRAEKFAAHQHARKFTAHGS